MKKRLLAVLFVMILAVSGCQSKEAKQKEAIMKAFEEMGVDHNSVIAAVLSKEWNVAGSEKIYTFTKEGEGNISGEAFQYSCGFDEENRIALKITMEENGEESYYFISVDDTGYGLYLESADGKETIYLFQNDMELLDMKDTRAKALIGEWADKSDNRYILREDRTLLIKGSSKDTEGTYSVTEKKEDGTLLLTMVFESDTLEYTFALSEDENTMELCRPGTDTIHTWIRK